MTTTKSLQSITYQDAGFNQSDVLLAQIVEKLRAKYEKPILAGHHPHLAFEVTRTFGKNAAPILNHHVIAGLVALERLA